MTYMFAVCNDLCQLDLRSFDMSSVSSTTAMFTDCSSLRTIYYNDDWSILGISEYEEMFTGCDRLIGKGDGNVCRYDSEATGLDAARPCTAGTPGYFTAKAEEKGNSADVNGDGSVDVADIATVISVMAGDTVPDASSSGRADVNGDGTVDVADIASVISVMAGQAEYAAADVNGDTVVDVADIATIISIMAENARRLQLLLGE